MSPHDVREPTWPEVPPGEVELITDDGEPMDGVRHREQASLLLESLVYHWRARSDFFVAANLGFYFSETQVRSNDFRAPDLMVVLDTTRRPRKAWVVWTEDGRRPNLVVELLSDSTREVDRGIKKRVYETLGIPEYLLAYPDTVEMEGHRLAGSACRPIVEDAAGRLGSDEPGLRLGTWGGEFNGLPGPWARWFTPDGQLVLTAADAEAAQRAAAEARAADESAQRAAAEARAADESAQRAAAEARATEQAARAAEQAARADALEQRLAALEEELRRR